MTTAKKTQTRATERICYNALPDLTLSSGSTDCALDAPDHKTRHSREEAKHVVDELIEERAVRLMHSPLWPLYKSILYPILLYGPAVKMADAVADRDAMGVFDYVSELLHIDLSVTGLENIPKEGRVLIAATHPTGIPDGVAMFDALKTIRPDMTFFANRDAIRAAPGIDDMIIPVVWRPEERNPTSSRETLVEARAAFEAERCVVLFPSGRLAFMDEDRKLTEQPWLGSIASFARKYDCPIVPAKIVMRNSWLYYWFWRINTELRDITLFHELLNKKNKPYQISFGAPIAPDEVGGSAADAAEILRRRAMRLSGDAPYMAPRPDLAPIPATTPPV